jgi:hypothetical protein
MKTGEFSRAISLSIILLVVLAACSAAPESTLAGSWKTPEGDMTLRFTEDGKFTASAPRGETSGTYRHAGEEKIQMEFDGLSTSAGVSVAGEKLTFCPEGHACDEFRRVR